MNKQTIAINCVEKIIMDLIDRAGLQSIWEEIDPDIQAEIKEKWESIIIGELANE